MISVFFEYTHEGEAITRTAAIFGGISKMFGGQFVQVIRMMPGELPAQALKRVQDDARKAGKAGPASSGGTGGTNAGAGGSVTVAGGYGGGGASSSGTSTGGTAGTSAGTGAGGGAGGGYTNGGVPRPRRIP